MTIQSKPTIAKRLALGIAGLNVLMLLAGFVLGISISARLVNDIRSISSIVYSVLAVLIISQHPRHTVGWLFLFVGFFSALGELTEGLEILVLRLAFDSELFHGLINWVDHLAWIPAFMLPISLVLQFFPDGRLPSRRWWPITAAAIMGMCGLAISYGLRPWPGAGIFDTYNPFAIPGSEGFFDLLFNLSLFPLSIGIIGSLVMVVVRFRWSQGVERTQMKWLVYTAFTGITALLLSRFVISFLINPSRGWRILSDPNPIADFIFLSLPILFAGTIGIAILRYRLWDIDIIIRRTLQYGLLTGLLALIYFGGVVLTQSIFSTLTGNADSPLITVISTLSIVVLFSPLRTRVQNFIDRRFYRAEYDAERTLAQFAATARDEVDVERLTDALLGVIEETMQPESLSLWLAED